MAFRVPASSRDPALDAHALGFQRERAGIAVGQRMLDRSAARRPDRVDEKADAVDEERQVVGHLQGTLNVSRLATAHPRAERPILRDRQDLVIAA